MYNISYIAVRKKIVALNKMVMPVPVLVDPKTHPTIGEYAAAVASNVAGFLDAQGAGDAVPTPPNPSIPPRKVRVILDNSASMGNINRRTGCDPAVSGRLTRAYAAGQVIYALCSNLLNQCDGNVAAAVKLIEIIPFSMTARRLTGAELTCLFGFVNYSEEAFIQKLEGICGNRECTHMAAFARGAGINLAEGVDTVLITDGETNDATTRSKEELTQIKFDKQVVAQPDDAALLKHDVQVAPGSPRLRVVILGDNQATVPIYTSRGVGAGASIYRLSDCADLRPTNAEYGAGRQALVKEICESMHAQGYGAPKRLDKFPGTSSQRFDTLRRAASNLLTRATGTPVPYITTLLGDCVRGLSPDVASCAYVSTLKVTPGSGMYRDDKKVLSTRVVNITADTPKVQQSVINGIRGLADRDKFAITLGVVQGYLSYTYGLLDYPNVVAQYPAFFEKGGPLWVFVRELDRSVVGEKTGSERCDLLQGALETLIGAFDDSNDAFKAIAGLEVLQTCLKAAEMDLRQSVEEFLTSGNLAKTMEEKGLVEATPGIQGVAGIQRRVMKRQMIVYQNLEATVDAINNMAPDQSRRLYTDEFLFLLELARDYHRRGMSTQCSQIATLATLVLSEVPILQQCSKAIQYTKGPDGVAIISPFDDVLPGYDELPPAYSEEGPAAETVHETRIHLGRLPAVLGQTFSILPGTDFHAQVLFRAIFQEMSDANRARRPVNIVDIASMAARLNSLTASQCAAYQNTGQVEGNPALTVANPSDMPAGGFRRRTLFVKGVEYKCTGDNQESDGQRNLVLEAVRKGDKKKSIGQLTVRYEEWGDYTITDNEGEFLNDVVVYIVNKDKAMVKTSAAVQQFAADGILKHTLFRRKREGDPIHGDVGVPPVVLSPTLRADSPAYAAFVSAYVRSMIFDSEGRLCDLHGRVDDLITALDVVNQLPKLPLDFKLKAPPCLHGSTLKLETTIKTRHKAVVDYGGGDTDAAIDLVDAPARIGILTLNVPAQNVFSAPDSHRIVLEVPDGTTLTSGPLRDGSAIATFETSGAYLALVASFAAQLPSAFATRFLSELSSDQSSSTEGASKRVAGQPLAQFFPYTLSPGGANSAWDAVAFYDGNWEDIQGISDLAMIDLLKVHQTSLNNYIVCCQLGYVDHDTATLCGKDMAVLVEILKAMTEKLSHLIKIYSENRKDALSRERAAISSGQQVVEAPAAADRSAVVDEADRAPSDDVPVVYVPPSTTRKRQRPPKVRIPDTATVERRAGLNAQDDAMAEATRESTPLNYGEVIAAAIEERPWETSPNRFESGYWDEVNGKARSGKDFAGGRRRR